MNDGSIKDLAYQALSDQQLSEIAQLCDGFDRELVDGLRPRIEAFLTAAPEAAQDGLLAELLAMEFEFRTLQGDDPEPDDYIQRFPQQRDIIDGVFARDATLTLGKGAISTPVGVPPVLANFELIEELGHGGMGIVWLAEQHQPVKRRVALKLINSELTSKDVIARFEAEKQALAMMDHANIARVLDAGSTEANRPYFVMELVDGIAITQYCDDNKLSVDERLKLFVPVCKAVQHAHQKGIIHRDLKPSNVLVTVIDGEAVPKVIDFGLAKAVEQDRLLTDVTMQTDFGKVVGTVQYMSPEQAELRGTDGEDVDTRTDVYSLGVMLYELLTGSTPLDKETLGRNALLKVLEIIREQEPPRPSNRLSASSHDANSVVGDLRRLHPARLQQLLKGELDWVVMKALEKDRARRYQTANNLGQDLANYLSGQTVAARPPSTWYQIQKFAGRNRGLVAAVLAIGIALLAGISGTSYGLIRANQKTAEAEEQRGKAKDSEQLALLEKDNARKNEVRAIGAEELASAETNRARDSEAKAKFQLSVARYDANRAVEARSLLHQIPLEYRDNFEWHHCNRRFQGSDITYYGHTSEVYDVSFTPDGTRMVSAGGDGKIKLWDPTTGQGLGTFGEHEGRVLALAVSADGTRIASAGDDKTVVLRDMASGEVIHTLSGHAGSINCVAFSPAGDRIATACEDKTVKLWDATSGDEIITIAGHNAAVRSVAFSPHGEQFASVGVDRLIRIWDARSGESITELRKHGIEIQSVAFSPDGKRLIASSVNYVTLWDAQTWQFIAATGLHDGQVRCVCFSPDGTQFATGGDDTKIKLWDTRVGTIIKTLSGHGKSVWGVAFSPDGSRLVSGSHDRTVRIWDTSGKDRTASIGDTGADNSITLLGHLGHISSVLFSSDGTQLASSGNNGSIILRNAQTSEVLFTLKGHRGPANDLSFSPDGTRLASGGDDHTVRIWDTQTGLEITVLNAHSSWVRGVAFSPDGAQLATSGRNGNIKLWDTQTYEETTTLKGHRGDVYCVAFSPDGSRLASGSFDRTVKMWDVQTGKEIRTFLGHTGRVRSVAFGPQGERIVSGGYDSKVRVWDVASGKQLATGHVRSGAVFGLAFSPDGNRIAAGDGENTVKLFDAFSGEEVMPLRLGNSGSSSVNFSANGKRLAVAAMGIGRTRIFDAQQEHETTFLSGHTDTVASVTFSVDGSRIYSESENEKLVWNVATQVKIQDAMWEPPEVTTHTSANGRWMVSTESNNVVLVNLHFKNTPDEIAYRLAKSRFDPFWHQEQAEAATTAQNWYSAVFHYALLLNDDPAQVSFYDGLQSSFQEFKSQFEQRELGHQPYVKTVVKKALKLPRRREWANSSFEEPEVRKGSFEFRKAIPGWKNTEQEFEIWSTGFLGIEAHDGNQFVELNANEEGTLYQHFTGVRQGDVLEFSFGHRGRNGDDTLKLTINDLGPDNSDGGGDDTELFAKEYTTGKSAWAVYDSTTEPNIVAMGNKVRFAYTAVHATGGRGPDNSEGNFLDSAEFGVGVVSAKRKPSGAK